MSQLRKPLTAGAVDEYLNHIKTRLSAGDNASELESALTDFDSDSSGDVVKQRLNQVISTLKQTRSLTNGQVTIAIDDAGTGYSVGDTLPVVGDVGDVASIAVTDGGTGYSVGDAVVITGDGSGATAEVGSETGGVIDTITVLTGGTGYTTATVDASATGNGDATGTATVNPIAGAGASLRVTSVGGSGEITGIEVSGGAGYVSTATVTAVADIGNEDATFTTSISNELNTVDVMAASIAGA